MSTEVSLSIDQSSPNGKPVHVHQIPNCEMLHLVPVSVKELTGRRKTAAAIDDECMLSHVHSVECDSACAHVVW